MTPQNKGNLFIVSGPAGVGKGTICKELVKKRDDVWLSVSATSRQARLGELEGREYYFVSKDEFERMIESDELLEYNLFVNGNYYGTPCKYVDEKLKEGKNVILEIDVCGAAKVKEKRPDAILVFILPPSMQVLEERLRGRGTETEEDIKSRLARATEELEAASIYNYLIMNTELSAAVEKLSNLITKKSCKKEN